MSTLYVSGVPLPFECEYAARVESMSRVEKAFHKAFSPYRINPKREFFEIEPSQAIALLELIGLENVTPAIQKEADEEIDAASNQAGRAFKKKRSQMNFREMGIPMGAILLYTEDTPAEITAEVVSEKKVSFEGEVMSLSRLTRQLLGREKNVQPSGFWTYQGRNLKDIYEETYSDSPT